MIINVYTDGASRNNPGRSASGYEVFDGLHKFLLKDSFYNGIRTNNAAEYLALIGALKRVGKEYGFDNHINVYSDSELMINQLKGIYKVKDADLRLLHREASTLISRFKTCRPNSIPRENRHIMQVDKELNRLLDRIEKNATVKADL